MARWAWIIKNGLSARSDAELSGRLGWSHGDDELFSLQQAIDWFDGTIQKKRARFDFDKLKSVNHH